MTEPLRRERGLLNSFAAEHPEQFGHVLASCRTNESHQILNNLPTPTLIEVLAYAPRQVTVEFVETQGDSTILKWIHQGSNDAVARIVRRLPEEVRAIVLPKVKDVNKLRILREYVSFAKNSVAALADKDFISFSELTTCTEVRKRIRQLDESEVENVLIVASDDRVLGILDDRKLLRSGSEEPIKGCVKRTTLLPANAPTKSVVESEDWHNVDRLPVVDRGGRAIGILHWKHLAERMEAREHNSNPEDYALVMEVMSTMLDLVKELPRTSRSRQR